MLDDFKVVFKEIEKEEGKDFMIPFLTLFKDRITSDIDQLEVALANENYTIIRDRAHVLIGSLSVVNLNNGSALAKKTEEIAKRKLNREIGDTTQILIDYLKTTLHEINN